MTWVKSKGQTETLKPEVPQPSALGSWKLELEKALFISSIFSAEKVFVQCPQHAIFLFQIVCGVFADILQCSTHKVGISTNFNLIGKYSHL